MKVRDILEHVLSRSSWVDRSNTVDRVIAGDPDLEVDRGLVSWMPGMAALAAAADRGIRLLVCHEPTFWHHRDDRPESDARSAAKQRFIADHGLAVLRLHDSWDRWPEIGIPWAWARFLELGQTPAAVGAAGYQHRYDIAPVALEEFARQVAARCAAIGEPLVQVSGDGAQQVGRIGIGTGCGCDVEAYLEMGCDCSVVCDDGSCYWAGIQRARDLGHPVIRVNHGTSEEPGMVTLTRYLDTEVPGLRAEQLPHGSCFRLVGTL